MPTLAEQAQARLDAARRRLDAGQPPGWPSGWPGPSVREIGRIEQVGDGIALVAGLPGTRLDELLDLPGGCKGLAVSLEPERIGVLLLDREDGLAAGAEVRGTGEVLRVPVGDALPGRVVDPLGRPLDGGPPLPDDAPSLPVERQAPGIVDRALVEQPLHTGILAVDALIPLGRGQRQLIIGDRGTGKTTLAVDAILSQQRSDMVCIYAAIGQRAAGVRRVIETVRAHGAPGRCIFVVADAEDPPGLQWIAPFAAMAMAEHIRDAGGHALLVLDDLIRHANVHRQIALLLRQPPGREAYPGDVFYLHSRLLERAARLAPEHGGGTLTVLPIVETEAGNLTGYIPTNLISITDGQILLDARLFQSGQKPAVDIGRSVSRVGGRAQSPALGTLAGPLKLDYAQFLELEAFVRFGQMVDARTQAAIEHGRRIRALLAQPPAAPLPLAVEVVLLLALQERLLDGLDLEQVARFRQGLEHDLAATLGEVAGRLECTDTLSDEDRAALALWARERAGTCQGALRAYALG